MLTLAASAVHTSASSQVNIADIGKALGAEQLLGDLRRDAGERIPFEADRGDFRRWLGGERFSETTAAYTPSPANTRGARDCGVGHETGVCPV